MSIIIIIIIDYFLLSVNNIFFHDIAPDMQQLWYDMNKASLLSNYVGKQFYLLYLNNWAYLLDI